MFKHTIHGVTVSSVLDKRRAYADGDFPVRIVVSFRREKKYYTTGKSCTEEVWDRMPNTKTKEIIDLRGEIQIVFELIKGHVIEVLEAGDFSLKDLDMSLRRSKGTTLGQLIEARMTELRSEGRIGTMESFRSTLTNLRKYHGEATPIDQITVEWLKKYESYLAKSRSTNTIGINMRNLRVIMNSAIKQGYVKHSEYPFGVGKYEIKTAEGVKKALSVEQIDKIKKYHSTSETLVMLRDLWLFIYYCNGINIADLIGLKYSNIIDGEILFVREKTKRTTKNTKYIRATLTGEMQRIIDKWGNPPAPDSPIFNLVEPTDDPQSAMDRKKWFCKDFNQHLKLIGAALGIDNLTSYVARHSVLS